MEGRPRKSEGGKRAGSRSGKECQALLLFVINQKAEGGTRNAIFTWKWSSMMSFGAKNQPRLTKSGGKKTGKKWKTETNGS